MERGEYAFVFCRFSHCDINYHGPSDAVLGSKAKPFQQLYWCGPFLCFYIHHEILESSVYYQVSVSISQYFLIHFFVDVLFSFFYVPWRLSIERQDASAPSWRWTARLTSDWNCCWKIILWSSTASLFGSIFYIGNKQIYYCNYLFTYSLYKSDLQKRDHEIFSLKSQK